MIPKIIHLCWLSNDEFPKDIKKCIESWERFLPDYEIMLWNRERFDINSVIWTKEAFEAKKYAFAADYIRLYALYNHGGIYLDSDVLVYKSFDELLSLPYFIGEDYLHCFEPAIIGCVSKMPWIESVLKRYEGLSFIDENGNYNMETLPVVFRKRLSDYHFEKVIPGESYDYEKGKIKIFPSDFFNSRDYLGPIKTENSFCSHNFAGSWLKNPSRMKSFIKRVAPRPVLNFYYRFCFNVLYKSSLAEKQIPY